MLQAWWFKDSSLSCQQNNWNSTHPQLGNEPSTKVPHTASSAVIIFHLRSCSLDCAASSSSSVADAASSKCVIRNTATGFSQCACPTLVLACICSSSSLPPTWICYVIEKIWIWRWTRVLRPFRRHPWILTFMNLLRCTEMIQKRWFRRDDSKELRSSCRWAQVYITTALCATAFGCVTSWNGSRVVSRLNRIYSFHEDLSRVTQ